ncbi:MAG: T9SS type A sorting domain-containing protein [Thermaurantimonas sp.]|uniref:T9SS type A sorting domain-containing protein n=1 Tax=Thermaurantimonas sp. TaxID=2681568 RepID=UPI00391AC66D
MKKILLAFFSLVTFGVVAQQPTPFNLSTGAFTFNQWSAAAPAGTFPNNMMFYFSNDPTSATYDSTAPGTGVWNCAYNLTARNRINGGGDSGIFFIATGSALWDNCVSGNAASTRFVGSAVAALNALGRENITVTFKAQTATPGDGNGNASNPRVFRLRLQYRLDTTSNFINVPGNAFYTTSTVAGDSAIITATLPAACNNQPLVQVRWVYYQSAAGAGGSRPRVRLDDITITSTPQAGPGLPIYPISALKGVNANGVADSLNVSCRIEGLVSGGNLRTPAQGGVEFWFISPNNDAGLLVRQTNYNSYTVTEGDFLRITGTVGQFNGLIQFSVDTIIVLSQNNPLPNPAVVTKPTEATEGRLIRIDSLRLVTGTTWNSSGSFNASVYNTVNDTFILRINGNTTASGTPQPTGFFNVIGHGNQFDNTSPFTSGYQIQPRRASDITTATPPPPPPTVIPTYNIAQLRSVNAQGVLDSLNVYCRIEGIVSGGNLLNPTQQGAQFWLVNDNNTAGCMVRRVGPALGSFVPVEGQRLRLVGKVTQFRGLFQFEPDSLTILSTGNQLPAPAIVTQIGENEEGRIIELKNLTLVDPAQWQTPSTTGLNVLVTNGTDTFLLRINQWTTLNNEPAPVGTFHLRGHGSQFTASANPPFVGGYQIQPRYKEDLIPAVNIPLPKLTISEVMFNSISTNSDLNADWFEIRNYGSTPVSLNGFSWDDDKQRVGVNVFPNGITIAPNEAIVVWGGLQANRNAFAQMWKMPANAVQILCRDQFTGTGGFPGLGTAADMVVLYDSLGREVKKVSWSNGTPGFTFNFDTAGVNLGLSVNGVNGAYTSLDGDVGSPGNYPVSIKELTLEIGRIYPNPASSLLNIEFTQPAQVEVINLQGQKVANLSVSERATLNVQSWPAGVYVFRITTASGTYTTRIMKK